MAAVNVCRRVRRIELVQSIVVVTSRAADAAEARRRYRINSSVSVGRNQGLLHVRPDKIDSGGGGGRGADVCGYDELLFSQSRQRFINSAMQSATTARNAPTAAVMQAASVAVHARF